MAGTKKGAETRKEKYGADYQSRIATNGGRKRTRGYFGYLKDTGQTKILKEVSKEGGRKAAEAREKSPSEYDSAKRKGNPVHRANKGQV